MRKYRNYGAWCKTTHLEVVIHLKMDKSLDAIPYIC